MRPDLAKEIFQKNIERYRSFGMPEGRVFSECMVKLLDEVGLERFPELSVSSASCVVLRKDKNEYVYQNEVGWCPSSTDDLHWHIAPMNPFLKERVKAGDSWSGDPVRCYEGMLKATSTVLETDSSVEVSAGRFDKCLRFVGETRGLMNGSDYLQAIQAKKRSLLQKTRIATGI